MGMVHLAEQLGPVRRQVALKVIKPGMDSRAVVARFEAERQALALMDHPSIARVYDAGVTPDGKPYFAMEYVSGLPITEYCDRERLPLAARLALFADVCAAVRHAHEKRVIHRDIKPTNVLVTIVDGRPMPKIIDFGVAKAIGHSLTERTVYTELGELIGTPEYMSPEQADPLGPDVDTRSDVYSLGVLLYELLVGALPFDTARLRSAGFDEIRRIISQEEPPRPSARLSGLAAAAQVATQRCATIAALLRELRGDLDWICLKTLEKDRRRRYQSAAELHAEIRRFIEHLPVSARAPSAAYRFRKYVRRHRLGAAASATTGLTLALGLGMNALISSRLGTPAAQPPGGSATVQVVTHSGFAWGPLLSPDGHKVVFGRDRIVGPKTLWMADVDTGNTEPLPIPAATNFFNVQWSRTGHLYSAMVIAPDTYRLLRYSLLDRQLVALGDLRRILWLAVSPDERSIAGVRDDPSAGVSVLTIANLDGSDEREIARRPREEPYFLLSWSPDGSSIAASVGNLGMIGKPMQVIAVDVSNGRERTLSDAKWQRAMAKAWLPDNRGLVMLGRKWGEVESVDLGLWHVDVKTGETRRIQIGPDELAAWSLSLSADGRTVAATRSRFSANLWITPNADSNQAREIAAAWMGPRFLPAGDLVFNGADKRLWRIAPDGSERSRIGGDGYAPYKAVARDVPTMVFALERDDVSQIWRADLDGRNAIQITHAGAATKPDISPDGKWVVYVTAADGALWRVPSTGGPPIRLASGIVSNPAVSTDGALVAMLFRETPVSPWVPALVRMDRPGVVTKLPLPPNTALWDVRFSRDGAAIDVALNDNEAGNVWRWPLDGSGPIQLTHFASEELRSFDWSWDGKLLACVRGGWRGDVVLLRGAW